MQGINIKPGDKFNDWTVIKRVQNYKRERAYLCKCKCGKMKILPSQKLRSNKECFMCKECSYDAAKKHGDSQQSRRGKRHPIYIAWDNMLRRCDNSNNPQYLNYGGRGIKVCNEWHDYKAFKEWSLSNGWARGLSIDRIDNNCGYEPTNCRWTTQLVQANNTRSTTHYTIGTQTKSLSEWSRYFGVKNASLYWRVKKRGISIEEVVKQIKGESHVTPVVI